MYPPTPIPALEADVLTQAIRAAADADRFGDDRYRLATVGRKDPASGLHVFGQADLLAKLFTEVTKSDRDLRQRMMALVFPVGPGGEIASFKDLSRAQARMLLEVTLEPGTITLSPKGLCYLLALRSRAQAEAAEALRLAQISAGQVHFLS